MTTETAPDLTALDFTATRAAIAAYYAECATGPDKYADGGYPGANGKAWRRTCDGLAFEVRETFYQEAAGAYTREACLGMTVVFVQCLLPRGRPA
jgi:hypothetical protein